MFDQIDRVLVLAPHTDDAEFGLGGTLAKLIEMGKEVHVAAFSGCHESIPPGFEPDSLIKEMYESLQFLGIPENQIYMYDFKVRYFPRDRQDILEELIELRKKVNPDLIFVPSSKDFHQDHKTIYEEGVRAFKHRCMLGYEMPWNNLSFDYDVFVSLDQDHLDKKKAALDLYKTQKHRIYSTEEFVTSFAVLRGRQIAKQYAETFELIRYIHS